MPMTVTLDNVGNPDRQQDPGRRLSGTRRWVLAVADLAEASRLALAYIAENDLGGGNWPDAEVTRDGKPFASISYNGVAWPPGRWRSDMVPLHDPRAKVEPVADPDAFEAVDLDLGEGLCVTVSACLRYGAWRLKGDTARIADDLLSGSVVLSRDAEPSVSCRSKRDEAKAIHEAVEAAVRSWFAGPDAKAVVFGNEVRARRRDLARAEEMVARHEADLARARDASVVARIAWEGAEFDLEEVTAAPRP